MSAAPKIAEDSTSESTASTGFGMSADLKTTADSTSESIVELQEVVEEEVRVEHSLRPAGIEEVIRRMSSRKTPQESKRSLLTDNIKTLILTAFLFTLITVAQYFAALVANSRALLMECRKRDGGEHKLSMLIVCALSLSFLVYFTYDAGAESWDVAQACWTNTPLSEEGDDVNGWVTLAFGAGGLLFDVISVWYFRRSAKKSKDARPVNMLTAFLHVGADLLRSASTVIMSLLILLGGYDSSCLDAYTSLLIGAMILCGAVVGIFEWVKLARSYATTVADCSHADVKDLQP